MSESTENVVVGDLKEFAVTNADLVEAHEQLNELMSNEGFRRISGDNYDVDGEVHAWGEKDED